MKLMIKTDGMFDAADAVDDQKRSLLTIAQGYDADSLISQVVAEMILFHKRYKIDCKLPPAHKSATCIVVFADDCSVSGLVELVALKFMCNKDQFQRELAVRKGLDEAFVIGVIRTHSSVGIECLDVICESDFVNSTMSFNHGSYSEYPYCIVLSRATRGLHEVITHDHIAGVPDRVLDVKATMKQIAEALMYLHSKGVVHGDLKPLNAMKVGETWKLIDFDAAAKTGKPIGFKCSTAYAPPELILATANGNHKVRDPNCSNERLIAHPSLDIWSFGIVFYLLITGQTLFHNDQEDNLGAEELEKLASWDQIKLEKALKRVDGDLLARDLLEKVLQPAPSNRPQTLSEICNHPFFSSATLLQTLSMSTQGSILTQEQEEQLNFLRFSTILVDHVTKSLANLFVRRWNAKYPSHHWESMGASERGLLCWGGSDPEVALGLKFEFLDTGRLGGNILSTELIPENRLAKGDNVKLGRFTESHHQEPASMSVIAYLEANSSSGGKFWEASVNGSQVITRWGKTPGEAGRGQTKIHKQGSRQEAEADAVAQADKKRAKGYVDASHSSCSSNANTGSVEFFLQASVLNVKKIGARSKVTLSKLNRFDGLCALHVQQIKGERNSPKQMERPFSRSVKTGNPFAWDMSLLSFLLTKSSHTLLNTADEGDQECLQLLSQLRNLRNSSFGHVSTCQLSTQDLNRHVDMI
jgi:serine/threonine protein kinase/predicted DNA-binding WGR domain protein